MIVYRLAASAYIDDLSGMGARLYGGRWNTKGMPCLYTSAHVSLALLEKFVHAQGREDMEGLMLMQADIPDGDDLVYHADASRLERDWKHNIDYSQWLGNQILNEPAFVAFSVPSAIVPTERNIILNPQATHFDRIKFSKPIHFEVDFRLR